MDWGYGDVRSKCDCGVGGGEAREKGMRVEKVQKKKNEHEGQNITERKTNVAGRTVTIFFEKRSLA